jgi:hypothetical protein
MERRKKMRQRKGQNEYWRKKMRFEGNKGKNGKTREMWPC